MNAILFTNARVFDGSGSPTFPGELRVEERRIAAVSAPGERLSREGATLVDCRGCTLMPGMVEAHARLTWPSSVERVINAMHLPLEQHVLVTAQNARITIDHGFTSAYSAGSLGEWIEPALRDTIKFLMSSDEWFAPGGSQVLMYSEAEAQAAEAVKRAVRACTRLRLSASGGGRPSGWARVQALS